MATLHVVEFKYSSRDDIVVWSQGFSTAKHATIVHNAIAFVAMDNGFDYGLEVEEIEVPDSVIDAAYRPLILKIEEFETTSFDEFEAEFLKRILEIQLLH